MYTAIGFAIGLLMFIMVVVLGRAFVFAQPVIIALWLLAGVGAFIAARRLSPVVQDVGQLQKLISMPIAGWVDQKRTGSNMHEVLPGLQRLLVNLRGWMTFSGREIVVTSADREDGKSALASGLAISLAESGFRVTLVDMNLRNPSVHQTFLIPATPGLAEHLSSPDSVESRTVLRRAAENLRVLPAGRSEVYQGILKGDAFKSLVRELRADSDVVIYDCDTASEMQSLLGNLDKDVYLLVAVRLQHTYSKSLEALAAQLRQIATESAGLVLFGAKEGAVAEALAPQILAEPVPLLNTSVRKAPLALPLHN